MDINGKELSFSWNKFTATLKNDEVLGLFKIFWVKYIYMAYFYPWYFLFYMNKITDNRQNNWQ